MVVFVYVWMRPSARCIRKNGNVHRILAGILVCTAIGVMGAREWWLSPRNFALDVLDVGQGTAALLTGPGRMQVLVDGGPDASVLEQLPRVMPFLDRRIELVVLSHPDSDHLTGLVSILERYSVDALLLTGASHDLPRYAALMDLAAARRIPLLRSSSVRSIHVGGITLDILWPPRNGAVRPGNNGSIVLKVFGGGRSVLLPGDIEEDSEQLLVRLKEKALKTDVLVVPHHGSRTSSSTGLLLAVRPALAVLPVGRTNRYGHPHADVVARYRAFGIELRSTAIEGNVHIPL
ncbi:MAG: competence protein ComEC [Candidatus Peregrinibacteria bacterium Gr01-1014_25]|nr:MAG: competence protein ComEC [Candidatus Peregrinibacteria bacterium Gr01-1014_25]